MSLSSLIFVSLEDWDDIWRRNQFLCDGLIRRHPDLRILFVEPPVDVSNAVRTRKWERVTAPRTRLVGASGRIICTRPWKLFPNSLRLGRSANERLACMHVQKAARRLGFRAPMLWINDQSAGHLAGRLGEQALIYDVTDDWTTFGPASPEQARTRADDLALCHKADAVIVCSPQLQMLKRELTDAVHLIPNGVDSAHYREVLDEYGARPVEAASWRGTVLGYTGSIHPERVDLALVVAIARRLPEATVVLVGPVMLTREQRQPLEALGNIVLTGPRPYAQIPAYMRAFDVCITPHVVTPFTESLNPIKLWEYLACGKPIVSTPVAGFRDYPGLVHLAPDAEGFAAALPHALSEPPEIAAARRAVAEEHSWEDRLDAVERVFSATMPMPQPGFAHV